MGRKPSNRFCTNPDCSVLHYANGWCKKHYTQFARHGRLIPESERGHFYLCSVHSCDRRATRHVRRTRYCLRHARQILVHGRLTPEREHILVHGGCTSPGCKEPYRAKGFCIKHYNQRFYASKCQLAEKKKRKRVCR